MFEHGFVRECRVLYHVRTEPDKIFYIRFEEKGY